MELLDWVTLVSCMITIFLVIIIIVSHIRHRNHMELSYKVLEQLKKRIPLDELKTEQKGHRND